MTMLMLDSQPRPQLTKNLCSLLLAAGITFSLFVVMDKLTHIKGTYVEPPAAYPAIDVVLQENKPKVNTKPKPRPIPEPKMPPPSLTKIKASPSDVDNVLAQYTPNFPSTFVQKAVLSGFDMGDSQVTPIFRTDPSYPVQAQRDGTEGWVKLVFSIDASGQVTDIQVVEAEPRRVFNREAKKALARWKYKPQMVDGKPTKTSGHQVVLDFKLNG